VPGSIRQLSRPGGCCIRADDRDRYHPVPLHAGSVVEPLAIVALLSFILAPVMRRLRNSGVPKVVAATFCVGLTLSVIGVLGATLGLQARQLALDLLTYETNLREKIKLLSNVPLLSRVLDRASGTLRDLQDELSRPESRPSTRRPQTPSGRNSPTRAEGPRGHIVRPLLSPLATTALVILFLLFILLQRADIRDRFLRLAGTADRSAARESDWDPISGSHQGQRSWIYANDTLLPI
jgi:predicted PurR-regulated permease PerM